MNIYAIFTPDGKARVGSTIGEISTRIRRIRSRIIGNERSRWRTIATLYGPENIFVVEVESAVFPRREGYWVRRWRTFETGHQHIADKPKGLMFFKGVPYEPFQSWLANEKQSKPNLYLSRLFTDSLIRRLSGRQLELEEASLCRTVQP